MTIAYRAALGPAFRDARLIDDVFPTAFTVVAQTDAGFSPPVTGALGWLKYLSGGAPGSFASWTDPLNLPWANKPHEYLCFHHRVEGDVGAGFSGIIARWGVSATFTHVLELWMDAVTASSWRYRLRDSTLGLDASSANVFDKDVTHYLRVHCDGTNIRLWVDGDFSSPEIVASYTEKPDRSAVFYNPSGVVMYVAGALWYGADTTQERPDPTGVEFQRLDPNANHKTDEYGNHADCAANGAGDYSYWVLVNDMVDTTTFNCELGGSKGEERSELTNAQAFGATTTIVGVAHRIAGSSNVSNKTVFVDLVLHDGVNRVAKQIGASLILQVRGRARAFEVAPDGGAWTEAKLNLLKAGVFSPNTNGANDHIPGLCVEVVATRFGDPQPPTGAGRRGQVF